MRSDPKPPKHIRDSALLKRFRLEHIGEPCDECDRPGIHAHHRNFRSRSGDDVESNLSWLCGSCHDQAHGIRSTWHH
jgi:RNase P subunit RPR2